jgi:hypothetical protein
MLLRHHCIRNDCRFSICKIKNAGIQDGTAWHGDGQLVRHGAMLRLAIQEIKSLPELRNGHVYANNKPDQR